jgi:lysyl-tRNA synthetase class 1
MLKLAAEEIQNHVYAIAMELQFEQKDWFKALYEILLGAEQGPRFGSFVALYGIAETIELIKSKI